MTSAAASLHDRMEDLLTERAARADLVVVAGPDPGPARSLADVQPDRVIRSPGVTSRLLVAAGARLVAAGVVVVLDASVTDLGDVPDGDGSLVLLTEHASHLARAHRAGLTVVQPAWGQDVAPLLEAALRASRSTLIRLHRGEAGTMPREVHTPLDPTAHRIIRRGSAGLVIGAGATAGILADVTRMMAGRQVQVTALEAHTINPGTGLDPALTDAHLLVGHLDAGGAGELTPVRVRAGEPRLTMKAVLETLRD